MTRNTTSPAWERVLREADLVVTLPGDVPMPFRRVPAGTFRMGSRGVDADEEPQHLVAITTEFLFGSVPVTQVQFAVWAQAAAVRHENGFPGHGLNPAENLDWDQAVAFCEWLTATGVVPAGWRASLPSEAQWEHACCAGTTTEYWSGDGEAALAEVGWYEGNSGGATHPVGEKPANPFGLYDVHGNVWEWCRDEWDEGAYRRRAAGVCDPLVLSKADGESMSDPVRVVRGGSWVYDPGRCRSSFRNWRRPSYRFRYQGFRVCLLPGPVATGSTGTGDRAQADGGGAEGGVEPTGEPPEGAGAGVDTDWGRFRGPRVRGPGRE